MRSMNHQRLRRTIQGIALLVQNANFKGFLTGEIYQGNLKRVCVPGLNCYSCPGAIGSCPIGSLQNALSSYKFKFPYYVVGLLLFFGAVLGRAICGFLCPFGLLQDLLHRIPFPQKVRTFRLDRPLRKLKYLILLVLVILLPICVKLTPFFCKYLCPAGTLAGLLLAMNNRFLFPLMGALFAWKAGILVLVVFLSILICRPFCKYLCPLGAIYAPLNKISLLQMELDENRCTACGKCQAVCPMCVDPSSSPNHTECIRCGKCIDACPERALHASFSAASQRTRKSSRRMS